MGDARSHGARSSATRAFITCRSHRSTISRLPEPARCGATVHTVERDARLHARVGVSETGLIVGVASGDCTQRREVSAGRSTGDGDERGVAAVLGDRPSRPGDRPLDVHDMLWPRGVWREAVGDRGAHPPASGHLAEQDLALHLFLAHHPGAAVHVEQHGRPGVRWQIGTPPDVQTVPLPELRVGDVAVVRVLAALAESRQRLLGDRQRRLATDRLRNLVTVSGAERGSECLVQERGGSLRGPMASLTRPAHGGQLDRQGDPARPSGQRAGRGAGRAAGARRLAGDRQRAAAPRSVGQPAR